jgi:Leucine-rich repeat (LRR) protein
MKKIEALFANLTEPEKLREDLKSINIEDINKYWLSGKLQQPKDEDEGNSDIKRLLLVSFAPENSLPEMQRQSPRLRTAPGYVKDFMYYRNEDNFEPAGTLTITKDFEILPLHFYPAIFEALQIKIVRIASDAYHSHFSTGKINWFKGIKVLELRGNFSGSNKFQSIPNNIDDLQDLEELTIIRTEISSVPESLFNLKNIKKLNLSGNKLTSISEKISQLTKLESIDLSQNKLEQVPDSLSALNNLTSIKVYDNPFKNISDFIAFHTYRYNYTFDDSKKQNVELKYPKNVLVINKSWLEVPLSRIEEIILTHQVKTLRVESVAMLNRILEAEAIKHFNNIICLDLQWNVWRNRQYESGLFRETEIVINLSSNDEANIKELPEGLGLMTWLEELNLKGNKLEKLPDSFFSLKKLKKLNLYGNKIKELPDLFSSFSELSYLDLGNIEFTIIPESIYGLKKLRYLNLAWNRNIADLSPAIGNLNELEELYLEANSLVEVPNELGKLNKLKKLSLNNNSLTAFPPTINNLSNLEELHVGNQKITELPNNLSGLSKLKHLNFEGAELQELTDVIGELKSIEVLNFKQNKITSISEQIKYCEKLIHFNLQRNNTLEKLPEIIGELSHLESLILYECEKINLLPASISKLKKLKVLDIGYTNFHKLPEAIFELDNLEELKLFNVPISELSSGIKKLINLKYLDLRLTKVTELPGEIGELIQLNKLHCSKLKKAIPEGFCKLNKLKELDVDFENVENPFPDKFGELSSLERLSAMSSKNLNHLPDSFGKLNNLKTLVIRNSGFKEFPLVLTELKNIGHLDLMDNPFSEVPFELTKLSSLHILYFKGNPLSKSNAMKKKCKALLPAVYFSFD